MAPRRLRRPSDLLRLVAALLGGASVLGLSYVASATTSGLDSDLSEATTRIPDILISLTRWVGLLGVIALPLGVSAALLLRRRPRQLVDALVALVVAIVSKPFAFEGRRKLRYAEDGIAELREYVDTLGGCLDGPGTVCHTYGHFYSDVETVELAKARAYPHPLQWAKHQLDVRKRAEITRTGGITSGLLFEGAT